MEGCPDCGLSFLPEWCSWPVETKVPKDRWNSWSSPLKILPELQMRPRLRPFLSHGLQWLSPFQKKSYDFGTGVWDRCVEATTPEEMLSREGCHQLNIRLDPRCLPGVARCIKSAEYKSCLYNFSWCCPAILTTDDYLIAVILKWLWMEFQIGAFNWILKA